MSENEASAEAIESVDATAVRTRDRLLAWALFGGFAAIILSTQELAVDASYFLRQRNLLRLTETAGFALEPQHFPDAINHPEFPSVVLRPGQTFRSTTVYKFTTTRGG